MRQLRRSKPFRQFQIVMNDGTKHRVRKPLWFACSDECILVLPRPGSAGLLKFKDVDHIEVPKRKGK
jgi:hypothetical protein